jgi:hypothetical protein
MRDDRPLDELSQEEIDDLTDEELMSRIEIDKDDRTKAQEYHQEERTKTAQTADESFRSTQITRDYETWKSSPSEYDFPGVDTVATRFKQRRAREALETAKETGIVSEFVEAERQADLPGADKGATSATTRGTFEPGMQKIGVRTDKVEGEDRADTLAHEIGHAVDFGDESSSASAMSGLGIFDGGDDLEPITVGERTLDTVGAPTPDDDPAAQEMRSISEDRRDEITEFNADYRDDPTELAADFFGSAITRPRNTKAKAPAAAKRAGDILKLDEKKKPSKEFADEFFPDSFFSDG